MNVNVLLSGKLRVDSFGKGKPENGDGTYRLALPDGSTVGEVIRDMNVPPEWVAMTMVNARKSEAATPVKAEDRVILIPSDVALLWRHLGLMDLGAKTVIDF